MEKADFKRSLAVWAEEEGRASDGHPSIETLRDGRAGLLAPKEKESLEEHLVACRQCFDLAQDLEAFSQARQAAAGPPPEVADFETAAFWRTLRPRLEVPSEPTVVQPPTHRRGVWRLPTAVAASVLLTALGFSFWVGSQHRALAESEVRIAALEKPRPNTRIYDLYLDTSERSGESSPQPVEVPAGSMLILTPHDTGVYPGYAVEIHDSEGKVWADDGFAADPADGTFTLWLPPDFLPPGEYRVRLLGRGAETDELIEEYGVRMVP